jgi:hypothetical protein
MNSDPGRKEEGNKTTKQCAARASIPGLLNEVTVPLARNNAHALQRRGERPAGRRARLVFISYRHFGVCHTIRPVLSWANDLTKWSVV